MREKDMKKDANAKGRGPGFDKTLSMVAALAAAGCSMLPSVGPDYEEPDVKVQALPLPDAGMPTTNLTAVGEYKSAEADADLRTPVGTNQIARWWARFDDAVLSSLVDDAVRSNRTYLMAQERLEASRWQLVGTYAAYLPKLNASGSFTRMERREDTSSMFGTGRTLHRDMYSAGFDASWEIDIFGGSRRATEAAWAQADAEGWSVADAWVSLTAEVGSRYVELRTTQQRIAVARTNLVLQTETYDILKSRLDSGIGDDLAVSQSKYIVDQTHATIPPLHAREESLKNAIAILTGVTPGALDAKLAECPGRNWLPEPVRLDEIPLDLVRNRPDVRVAERKLAAQVARIGVAKSQWFPKLRINGSLGLDTLKMDKFIGSGALYGSLGPSISWPIFQGGSIYANVKAEEAKTREACLAYERAVDSACRDIRDAYSAYTQEYHRYEALKGASKAAEDAVNISNNLYKNGLKDFTAVIDAQRSQLSLQEALVVSRGQITENLIALYKSLGGGFVAEEAGEAK
jgi:NodT family efflux transporter outer membrane factor (OMF) lipoprotein